MLRLHARNGGWSRYRLLRGEGQSKELEYVLTSDLFVKSQSTVSCAPDWEKIRVAVWYTLDGYVCRFRKHILMAQHSWVFPRTRTGLRDARLLTAVIKSTLDLRMINDVTIHGLYVTHSTPTLPNGVPVYGVPAYWGTLTDATSEIVTMINGAWKSALERLNIGVK
jgi:hypothetical protein